MKLNTIRISETKLKVMLSKEDMENYHIISSEFDCGDPYSRTALKELLKEAGRTEGLDCERGRMFIQLYPDRDGGCEIFVTMLSEMTAPTVYHNTDMEGNMPKSGTFEIKNVPLRYRFTPDIYEFSDFEAMLLFCRRLDKRKKDPLSDGVRSSLFTEREKKIYYLVTFGFDGGDDISAEYGGLKRHNTAYAYIKEHCRRICEENAIEKLSALS